VSVYEGPLGLSLIRWLTSLPRPIGVEGFVTMWHDAILLLVLLLLYAVVARVVFHTPWTLLVDLVRRRVVSTEGHLDVDLSVDMADSAATPPDRLAVAVMTGEVEPTPSDVQRLRDEFPVYWLKINGLRFMAAKPALAAIEEGQRYTVYYTPWSQQLVALEWCGQAG
jgi:hypothetical protein